MAYSKTNWQTGDIITADKLNNAEEGIYNNALAISDVKSDLSGWNDTTKQALLQLAAKVAYIDDDGQDYYDALEAALYPPSSLVSISAVYTQSGTVYTSDTLNSLKDDLVVTALYDDQSTATVTAYTLTGTLETGTSTITVTYNGKTTTFNVTVTFGEDLDGVFFTGTSFSTTNDTVTLQYGSSSGTANRLAFATDSGDHTVQRDSSSSQQISIYPIRVPQAATKMIFGFYDSNGTADQSVGMNNYFVKWDSATSTWKRTEDRINYTYGEGEHDIVAADNDGTLYAVFTFRNSANTNAINSVDRSNWVLAWR